MPQLSKWRRDFRNFVIPSYIKSNQGIHEVLYILESASSMLKFVMLQLRGMIDFPALHAYIIYLFFQVSICL